MIGRVDSNAEPPLRRHSGQSSVEFVVLCLVLAILAVAVPLVGRYIDLIQAAEQAGRYVAFEGMARNSRSSWKSDADLANEVGRRFFSSPGAPLKTGDLAGDFPADRNPLWTDGAGHPLLDDFAADVGVTTKIESETAIAAAVFRAPLNLSNANLYTATVSVRPANAAFLGAPWSGLNLVVARRTVLLADAWTGFGPADVRRRIEGSVTMYPEGPARTLLDALGDVPALLFDPTLDVGLQSWDVVPCDRLVEGC